MSKPLLRIVKPAEKPPAKAPSASVEGFFDWKPSDDASGTQDAYIVDWRRRWRVIAETPRKTSAGTELFLDAHPEWRERYAHFQAFADAWERGEKDTSAQQAELGTLKNVQDDVTRANQELIANGTPARAKCYDEAFKDGTNLAKRLPECGLFPRMIGPPLGWKDKVGVDQTPNVRQAQEAVDTVADVAEAARGTADVGEAGLWAFLKAIPTPILIGAGVAAVALGGFYAAPFVVGLSRVAYRRR